MALQMGNYGYISPTIEVITLLTAVVSGAHEFPTVLHRQENQGTGTSQASLLTSYTTEVGGESLGAESPYEPTKF